MPAHLIVPDVPWVVSIAIERALNISSAERFATVEEFWRELTSDATKQQIPAPRLTVFETLQSLSVPEQELERMSITPPSTQYYYRAPRSSKRAVLMPILLALLFTAAVGTILLWSVLQYGSPPAPQHSVTRSKSPSTPQSTVTSAASPAPSTPTSVVSAYPVLATSYGGIVVDLLTNEKTSMFLMQIQQNKGSISGYFQGLGLVGPFNGKVTTTGHVQFKVQVQASGTTLSFEGDIKIGGDIVGSFQVFDQHGQHTGESGAWNVAFYS